VADEEPLNVNVFMPFVCASDKTIAAQDEARVGKVSRWLWDCILPTLTEEVLHNTHVVFFFFLSGESMCVIFSM
jgi:hypothetical protein